MSTPDRLLSMAAIARAANVHPAALSRLRHRGQGFPRPQRIGGTDRFWAEEMARFFDGRKIPRNARREGEPAGTTYGERFRRNLGMTDPSPRKPAEASTTTASQGLEETLDAALWEPLMKWGGAVDLAAYEELLLGMLVLRSGDTRRWAELVRATEAPQHQSAITDLLDQAFRAQEAANPDLHGVLPHLSRHEWHDQRLAEILRALDRATTGGATEGRLWPTVPATVCRFLLDRFATVAGDRSGEFFTPAHLVRLMVVMTAPRPTERIYDPSCGSGEILVGAVGNVEQQVGGGAATSVLGQALSTRSWRLAKMNLAIHGITAALGPRPANPLQQRQQPERPVDVVIANPPFNMSGWSDGSATDDPRWRYGLPPEHNANFAWLQLPPSVLSNRGRAAVLMANAASDSQNPRERAIRAAMVEDGVVECIVALPPKLFRSTAIPVTLWLLRNPSQKNNSEILFVDATAAGTRTDRAHQVLTDEDTNRIASTYHEWRTLGTSTAYDGVAGFSRSVSLKEIRERNYALNPRAYVVASAVTFDSDRTTETLQRLREELQHLHARALEVDAQVEHQLRRAGVWSR
jgi:type I restriction enzyme M protein